MLVFYPEKCTGCRICMIVCGFHFTRSLCPSVSSIEPVRFESIGETATIKLYKEDEGKHRGCDLCEGEKGYLCIEFCSGNAIVWSEKN